MKIYLDIDETILDNSVVTTDKGLVYFGGPVKHLKEFLTHILTNHDVYWLTTHCNGDAEPTINYLKKHFDQELIDLVSQIKPTSWVIYKLEAIDLDEDFLWFDDYITQHEEQLLEEAGKLHCHIMVNLDENPEIFEEFLDV